MKNKIKYIILTIISFTFINSRVNAAASISAPSSVTNGQSFTVSVNYTNAAAWSLQMTSNGPVKDCALNPVGDTGDGESKNGTAGTVTCTATGTGTITITLIGTTSSGNPITGIIKDNINTSKVITVTAPQQQPQTPPSGGGGGTQTPQQPTSNSNLINSLTVSNCDLSPAFNSNTRTYSCTTDAAQVNISGSAEGGITNGGTKNLNFGSNSFTIRAKNSTVGYTINITRNDTRSNDATLSSLSIDGQTINFDPQETSYDLLVNNTIESIIVNATTNDPNASVIGEGEHFLNVGDNLIEVVVTAENGEQKTYNILVVRSEKANIPSSSLTTLSFKIGNDEEAESKNLNVSTGKKVFHVSVDSSVTKLDLDYATSSKTSKYNVKGADNLKEGLNKVTIEVSDEDSDTQTYTIYVYRQPIGTKVVESLKELEEIDSDIIYNSNKDDEAILPSEAIKLIKNSNNKLIYNITNSDGGVLYSFIIDKNSDINDTIKFEFIKTGNDPLSYSSNIPKGIEINAYIEELYEDGTNLKLYTFDQKNNKYILISENIKVENGYVKFVSDGSSNYVLSKDALKIKTTAKEWLIRVLCLIIGAAIATAINFIVRQMIAKKHPELLAAKEDKKEESKVEEKVVEPEVAPIKEEREEPKFEIKEEPIEEPVIEPIKPLSMDEIEEEIKPKKELNINNIEPSVFSDVESNDSKFEEPSYEIKPEEEKKSEEPRRNIFGEIIDENKKPKETKMPKSVSSKPSVEEEIKPFVGEPVGNFSTHQGIEIEEDDVDIDDINLDNIDIDLDLDLDTDIPEDIPEEPKPEHKTIRKQIFDDDDDDDVVKFPKF